MIGVYKKDKDNPNIPEGPEEWDVRSLAIAPRRSYDVRHCTDLAISDIVMYAEDSCFGQIATCDWYGYFKVVPHNKVDDTLTYSWSVTPGRVIGVSTEPYMQMAYNNVRDAEVSVTCTITGTNGSDTLTADFRTNHSGRIEDDAKTFEL